MTWLRRLFGKEPINAEEYERVRCDVCGGTGIRTASATPADPRSGAFQPRVRACGKCHGKGFVPVKR
jgi:DnaJ-class molecular chaperone